MELLLLLAPGRRLHDRNVIREAPLPCAITEPSCLCRSGGGVGQANAWAGLVWLWMCHNDFPSECTQRASDISEKWILGIRVSRRDSVGREELLSWKANGHYYVTVPSP